MKNILAFVFAFIIAFSAYSQTESGLFLSLQCARKSQKHTVMLTNKQVCIAENPIILVNEFTAISDLQELGGKIWFDLTLSVKAIQKLMQLSSSLPNSTFALVVDKSVFYVFPASDLQVGRTFRFQSESKDKPALGEMQRKLKGIVDSHTQ